jgi:hypothetical protein
MLMKLKPGVLRHLSWESLNYFFLNVNRQKSLNLSYDSRFQREFTACN